MHNGRETRIAAPRHTRRVCLHEFIRAYRSDWVCLLVLAAQLSETLRVSLSSFIIWDVGV